MRKTGKVRKIILLISLFSFAILLGAGGLTIIKGIKASIIAATGPTALTSPASAVESTDSVNPEKPPDPSESSVSSNSASPAKAADSSRPASSTVSGAAKDVKAPDGQYYISMCNILQRPELPTGCEATALTIVLNYLGFKVDKCSLVDHYLPVTSQQDSLNNYFIGSPYLTSGLGCNAPVIVKTADKYFADADSSHKAALITGSTPDELYTYVSKGKPVICWTTIAMLDTQVSATWTAADTGETVNFMENEHCTVLVGYNTNKDTVTLNDPWQGIITYSMSLFETRYHQLGNQAIIIT